MVQAMSYIKILAEIKSVRNHLQMLPDLQNSRTFSSVDDSQYTVYHIGLSKQLLLVYVAFSTEQFLCNFYCDIYQTFNGAMRPRSFVKPFKIFTSSEIIIVAYTYGNLRIPI